MSPSCSSLLCTSTAMKKKLKWRAFLGACDYAVKRVEVLRLPRGAGNSVSEPEPEALDRSDRLTAINLCSPGWLVL